jgi:hypothetical protein
VADFVGVNVGVNVGVTIGVRVLVAVEVLTGVRVGVAVGGVKFSPNLSIPPCELPDAVIRM